MKNLKTYIDQQNLFNKMFGGKVYDADKLTDEDKKNLRDSLEGALSPENLSCDGELRGSALQKKAKMLRGALDELNKL